MRSSWNQRCCNLSTWSSMVLSIKLPTGLKWVLNSKIELRRLLANKLEPQNKSAIVVSSPFTISSSTCKSMQWHQLNHNNHFHGNCRHRRAEQLRCSQTWTMSTHRGILFQHSLLISALGHNNNCIVTELDWSICYARYYYSLDDNNKLNRS